MSFVRLLIFSCCTLLGAMRFAAAAPQSVTDSLQQVLAHTTDPALRVRLLLDLKDLNEETNLNLAYSIQLFREAAAIADTYPLTAAIVPIVNSYALYDEKRDSLRYYIDKLYELTPGTPEEGLAEYTEMSIAFSRLRNGYNARKNLEEAHSLLERYAAPAPETESIYEQAQRLLLTGYSNLIVSFYEQGLKNPFVPQTDLWRKAFELTERMPNVNIRKTFASIIYFTLSGAYNQAHRYDDQVDLTNRYIALLDNYYADSVIRTRRPYLYADNSYVRPYQQLMRCALNIDRLDYAEQYFNAFRKRMTSASGENLLRNKSYLYELGYLWKGNVDAYDEAIQYSDSLIRLIESGKGYFRMLPGKIYQSHRDRSVLFTRAKRYDEAAEAYEQTLRVQDSILTVERLARQETIRQRHEMDKRKLSETRAVIRNRATASISFVVIGLLMLGAGVYLFLALQRNRKLRSDILRHSRKAQESEQMKSNFINTICRGIGPPFNAVDRAAYRLMISAADKTEREALLESIRENTTTLLSTLDNMFEAANLDSLTDGLKLEEADIDELCRAELLTASRLNHRKQIEYRIETPGTGCIVRTHAKYFSFVVRALLDNAGKFTRDGNITLRYELDPNRGELRVTVSDTGCGIPPAERNGIFRSISDTTSAARGMSLALCSLIAERLSGTIRLDESYTAGARFIFTISVKP